MTMPPSRRIRRAAFAVAGLALTLAADPARAVTVERVISPTHGIEAWLVEDHTNPIISVDIAFRGGADLDPFGKEGLASMVAALFDEGAGDLDSQAFQRRLEDLSVSLAFSAGGQSMGVSMRTLTRNRAAAFDLLGLALTRPRFDPEPVGRVVSQMISQLAREAQRPDTIATRRLYGALFPNHPYGRPGRGTPESIAGITDADLRRFVGERFARQNLVVGVVGDIDAAELGRLLDRTFDALPARSTPWDIPDVVPAARGATIVVKSDVPQSAIHFAQFGVKRDDPDFYAAYVLNHVLGGGGFTSRLFDEVREKRGLAYSIGSSLYPMRHSALIVGSAGTANARVAETLSVLRAEWKRMADSGVTAAELDDAKAYLTGSFPLRFTSSGQIASTLTFMQVESLGIDYLDRRNAAIEAVTLADVNRVAKRLLDPDRLTVVVVGDPEGVTGTE